MDEQSQKALDAITAKDPSELTDNDKAVLRARVHYLGRKSRDKFKEALAEQAKAPDENGDSEADTEEKKSNTDLSQHPADASQDDGEDE